MIKKTLNLKKTSLVIGLSAVMMGIPMPVYAQSSKSLSDTQKVSNACDKQIVGRINKLNRAIKNVEKLSKISSEQKMGFVNDAQNTIVSLKGLQTKCKSDKDLTTLKADYQKIFSFRVKDVLLPHARMLISADKIQVPADKLNDLANKLQLRIQKINNPNFGKMLATMRSKVANAKKQQELGLSELSKVSVASFNANKEGTRATLKKSHRAIKMGVRNDREAWNIANIIWNKVGETK